MKNTIGNSISATLFGESHGDSIGLVLDGLCPGIKIDEDFIFSQLELRKAVDDISTGRKEADAVKIVSGCFNGYSTGTPITLIIENENKKSSDYEKTRFLARPGHADLTAQEKYHGFQDYRGGGHFSGRLTAPIVAAGAILIDALKNKGIYIGTHILSIKDVSDRAFNEDDLLNDINTANSKRFSVLDDTSEEKMRDVILKAKMDQDSVGGILETAIVGLPAGVGEPWFDSVESQLSHAIFSIPAVKGIQFGAGFGFASMFGSEANDEFYYENGVLKTRTNNNAGINGGITNSMPVKFTTVIKPTPSISKKQNTVDFSKKEDSTIEIVGRHDPCIVHRARVVCDSMCALVIADMLTQRFGTDYLRLS